MNNKELRISSISEFLDQIKAFREIVETPYSEIWFRGQSDASWPLIPGLLRPDSSICSSQESHLAKQFRLQSAGLHPKGTDAFLYFLMQHYGLPTRLLDWTTDPLMALCFAVSPEKSPPKHKRKSPHAAVYLIDANRIAKNRRFEGIASERHPVFKEECERIFDWIDRPQIDFSGVAVLL